MPSFTQTLLASDAESYVRATQSPFLRLAAEGRVSRPLLGRWLANDRLYIHAYIRGTGRLLSFLSLPDRVPEGGHGSPGVTSNRRLLNWAIDALVNIRREEAFFVDTATQYGIDVNLKTGQDGRVPAEAKLPGLRQFEALFDGLGPGRDADGRQTADSGAPLLPWLESAVVFYGTEKCYLDAWSWARSQQQEGAEAASDADGGALRSEFIPNWTGPEFVAFVDELGTIIDVAVAEAIAAEAENGVSADATWAGLLERASVKWAAVLAAEEAFWPGVEEGAGGDAAAL